MRLAMSIAMSTFSGLPLYASGIKSERESILAVLYALFMALLSR